MVLPPKEFDLFNEIVEGKTMLVWYQLFRKPNCGVLERVSVKRLSR
jgi:hypothetical protein